MSTSSSIPVIFAAADLRRQQSLLVWPIAESRRAAAGVDRYSQA
jgi:glutamate synthase (NADPH/NADH) small chain